MRINWTKLHRSFRKFLSLFLALHLSTFQLTALAVPAVVRAQEASQSAVVESEETEAEPATESGELIEAEVSPEPSAQPEESEESNEVEISEEETTEVAEETEQEELASNIFYVDQVELNQTYSYHLNSQVSVTFTSLPENPGNLSIEEIYLSDEQVEELGALSNTAYDITSSMEDGSFTYDLTLPNPQPEEDVTVQYSEDGASYHQIGDTDVSDVVTVSGLDHFTVFVVTSPTAPAYVYTVIDDGDAEYLRSGSWNDHLTNGWASDHDWIANTESGAYARWTFTSDMLPAIGSSRIYLHWTINTNHSDTVQYDLYDDSDVFVTTIATVDQTKDASGAILSNGSVSDWYDAGAFTLAPGYYVQVDADNASAGNLVADAVRVETADLPSTVWVDDDYSGPDGTEVDPGKVMGYNAFATINEAVEQVAGDGVVYVEKGDYAEDVVIDKHLTLEGVKSPSGGNRALIIGRIDVRSDGVTIKKMRIEGGSGSEVRGIFVGDSSGFVEEAGELIQIRKNVITNISDADSTDAIQVKSYDGFFIDGIRIVNNTINNISSTGGGATGILLQADLRNIRIKNNDISDLTGLWSYGVSNTSSNLEPGNPQYVEITGNTVSNLTGTVYGSGAVAIDGPGDANAENITVERNDLSGADAGVYNSDLDTTLQAQYNWWGSSDGPTGSGAAVVVGSANYCPFLANDDLETTDYAGDCLKEIQGRTFIDQGGNGLLLSADGDYSGGMTDGFDVRLYDNSWSLLGQQTTNTTGNVGQYKFDGLLAESTVYYVCAVDHTDYSHSPATIGQDVVDTNNNPIPSYASAEIVANSSLASDESGVCWQVTLDDNDGAYLGLGYVDDVAPDAPVLEYPNNEQYFNYKPILNNWTDVSDVSGINHYEVEYVRDSDNAHIYRDETISERNHTPGDTNQTGFTVRVRAYDGQGNVSPWSNSRHYYYDITAPEATAWVSSPFFTRLGDTASGKVNITFEENPASDIDYYEYQYRRANLDGSSLGTGLLNMNTYGSGISCSGGECVWPVNFADGAMNVHRFRAVDLAGNAGAWSNWDGFDISTAPSSDFMYDDFLNTTGIFAEGSYIPANGGYAIREQVTPTSNITSPAGSVNDNSSTQNISYVYDDVDTRVGQVELWSSYEGGTDTLLSTDTIPSGSFSSISLSEGDGEYCLYTIAEDVADDLIQDAGVGNREAKDGCDLTLLLDTVAPESTISSPINDGDNSVVYSNDWDGLIEGTATDDSSGVSYLELEIMRSNGDYWNGSSWVAGPARVTPIYVVAGSWLYDLGDPAEDTYTLTSHAIDNAGNEESSYNLTVVVDKTIPEIDVATDPVDPDGDGGWFVTEPEITLTATDDQSPDGFEQIEYQWNGTGGTWTTTPSTTISFYPPGQGINTLYYRAKDKAGNYSDIGIKTIRWDEGELSEGPLNVSVSPNPTSGSTATVSWDPAEDDYLITKYEVIWQLDGTSTQHSKTVSSSTFSTEIDQLEEGTWTIKVKAFDGPGHSKEASTSLVVDRTAPAAPVLILDGTGAGTADLSWTAVDDAEEYLLFYGTTSGDYIYGANVGNTTNFTVQGLGAGTYFFIVRAKDAADNQSPNSNEVSTGAIAGAPGVVPGTPAEGFIPAGEVQGVTTEEEPAESGQTSDEGQILGVNAENITYHLPWIILLAQAILVLLVDFLRRKDRSMTKHYLALAITAIAIILFYWLVDRSGYPENTFLGFLAKLFAIFSIVTTLMVKAFSYGFIEEVAS